MKLEIDIVEKRLRFSKPFTTVKGTTAFRDVIYVALTDSSSGCQGFGEAAPLETFGTESYEDALRILHGLSLKIAYLPLAADACIGLSDRFPELTGTPTARFAIETAVLDLLSKRGNQPLAALLGARDVQKRIPVNAVLPYDTPEATVRQAEERVREGYKCLKLKIGIGTAEDEIRLISNVRAAVGINILIRLDANGAWNNREALDMIEQLSQFNIEYIEQPVPADDFEGLKFVAERSPVPLAADEAVISLAAARRIIPMNSAIILVIKPMRIGSLLASREIAAEALQAGGDVVFTSFLDSAIGRHAVAHLAASSGDFVSRHHGLATGGMLEEDIGSDDIREGMFILPNGIGLGISPKLV